MGGLKNLCTFQKTRKTLVASLQKTSTTLYANPTPTQIQDLTTTHLPTLLTQIDTLLTDGEFEETITDTALPLCFRPRCKQLRAELAWTQTVLGANPSPALASYAGVVLEMIALQVGRLVVDGLSDGDGFADEMERLVVEFEEGVKGRERLGDEGAEERERQVEMVWERLNRAYEGCGCFQCAWRFVG
jgi:hypothetical protein